MGRLTSLSKGFKAYILLAMLTLTAALPGIIHMPVLDRDEARFAQASRQMVQSEDYVTIQFQDELRNKKPAGIHWLQAASVSLVSNPDSTEIWPYRLPSLIGAIISVCLCFWLGSGLIGRPAAFVGTSLFATSLLLTTEAHIAKTDSVLIATTCLVLGALSKLYMGADRPRLWATLFWLGGGLSLMIKGPVILGLAAACLGGLYLLERRANWMRPLFSITGLLLCAALTLPWLIAVQIETDGAFLQGAIGKDFGDKVSGASEGHGGWPGYHTLFLLTHFFPGTLFIVPAIWVMVRAVRDRVAGTPDPLVFLTVWFVAVWLVFELLPTKLSHYVLPAYPALGLLAGAGLIRIAEGKRRFWVTLASVVPFLISLIIIGLFSSPDYWELDRVFRAYSAQLSEFTSSPLPFLETHYWLWGTGLALCVLALALQIRRKALPALTAALAASLILGWHLRAVILPAQSWLMASETAMQLLPQSGDGKTRVIGYSEPSLVFLSNNGVDFEKAFDDTSPADQAWLLNLRHDDGEAALKAMRSYAIETGGCLQESERRPAYNYSKGKFAVFAGVRITEDGCD